MTKLLEKALAEVKKLSAARQDTIGVMILEEIEEARWAKSFSDRPDVLERMAADARSDVKAGRAMPLEFPRRK